MKRSQYYILAGKVAVPCGVETWATYFENADRTLMRSSQGGVVVSTVFLGLNHNIFGGPPLIFETMIFGGDRDGEMERYSTWDDAIAGHNKFVQELAFDTTRKFDLEQDA
jgi:hypothetical protein